MVVLVLKAGIPVELAPSSTAARSSTSSLSTVMRTSNVGDHVALLCDGVSFVAVVTALDADLRPQNGSTCSTAASLWPHWRTSTGPTTRRSAPDDPRIYAPRMNAYLGPDRLKRHEYWHALPVGWSQLDYATFLDRRRTLMAKVIRDGFTTLWEDRAGSNRDGTLTDLREAGESQTLEYKSTARWNVHTAQPDKKMEHVIAKAVCGLLNAEGGTLLIGVDDRGTVLGLANDYSTLGTKGNRDGYELFLRQLLDSNLSITTAGIVNIRFEAVDGADVCVVYVTASGKPVFAKPFSGNSGPTDFWVRVGNLTKQLHGDDMVEYQAVHWG